jgi:hypothetical protein
MKRTELTPKQKAVDDVLTTAMSLAYQMRTKGSYPNSLLDKFLRAAKRLERRNQK